MFYGANDNVIMYLEFADTTTANFFLQKDLMIMVYAQICEAANYPLHHRHKHLCPGDKQWRSQRRGGGRGRATGKNCAPNSCPQVKLRKKYICGKIQ